MFNHYWSCPGSQKVCPGKVYGLWGHLLKNWSAAQCSEGVPSFRPLNQSQSQEKEILIRHMFCSPHTAKHKPNVLTIFQGDCLLDLMLSQALTAHSLCLKMKYVNCTRVLFWGLPCLHKTNMIPRKSMCRTKCALLFLRVHNRSDH